MLCGGGILLPAGPGKETHRGRRGSQAQFDNRQDGVAGERDRAPRNTDAGDRDDRAVLRDPRVVRVHRAYAGLVTPWAFLFGGLLLGMQALNAAQLAKIFPSAGGWYTWIARAFHPRAGFFAGVLFSVWLPPVGVLTLSYLAVTVLEPNIQAYYGVDVPWWIWVIAGLALVIFFAYQGIVLSEKALIITGSIEILIMVALAISGLVSTGPGGFSWAPLNPGNFHLASNLFLGVVFSIFAFSGWESTGPMAEESKNPKRNVPIGLVGSVVILMIYFVFVTWGYPNGIGVA